MLDILSVAWPRRQQTPAVEDVPEVDHDATDEANILVNHAQEDVQPAAPAPAKLKKSPSQRKRKVSSVQSAALLVEEKQEVRAHSVPPSSWTPIEQPPNAKPRPKRFSFRSAALFYGQPTVVVASEKPARSGEEGVVEHETPLEDVPVLSATTGAVEGAVETGPVVHVKGRKSIDVPHSQPHAKLKKSSSRRQSSSHSRKASEIDDVMTVPHPAEPAEPSSPDANAAAPEVEESTTAHHADESAETSAAFNSPSPAVKYGPRRFSLRPFAFPSRKSSKTASAAKTETDDNVPSVAPERNAGDEHVDANVEAPTESAAPEPSFSALVSRKSGEHGPHTGTKLKKSPSRRQSKTPASNIVTVAVPAVPGSAEETTGGSKATKETRETGSLRAPAKTKATRFSLRSIPFFHGHKPLAATPERYAEARARAAEAGKRDSLLLDGERAATGTPQAHFDKRALKSAVTLQKLIVGTSVSPRAPVSRPGAKKNAPPVSKAEVKRVRSDLMQPKRAGHVIAALRALPVPDVTIFGSKSEEEDTAPAEARVEARATASHACVPIHFVCLEHTEEEIEAEYFSKLSSDAGSLLLESQAKLKSVASASLESLVQVFDDLHIVDLLSAPDLGLGQPGDGEGILAGAVPTPETVLNGMKQITPQLMALGYATGRAIAPNHEGVYPPLDRMSVITYWWGLEITMPPPTMRYLAHANSIAHAVVNILSALAIMNNGVRELLPFVRYISQFMDFEWTAIKAQDKGKGVVCAATWIMPAAMVPRPWDFADPPKPKVKAGGAVAKGKMARKPAPPVYKEPEVAPPQDYAGAFDPILPPVPSLPSVLVTPPTVKGGSPLIQAQT